MTARDRNTEKESRKRNDELFNLMTHRVKSCACTGALVRAGLGAVDLARGDGGAERLPDALPRRLRTGVGPSVHV